jgi:hypothetical protein
VRHPRRYASRRKLVRLFLRGWSFRLLARWYRLPELLVEDMVLFGNAEDQRLALDPLVYDGLASLLAGEGSRGEFGRHHAAATDRPSYPR